MLSGPAAEGERRSRLRIAEAPPASGPRPQERAPRYSSQVQPAPETPSSSTLEGSRSTR